MKAEEINSSHFIQQRQCNCQSRLKVTVKRDSEKSSQKQTTKKRTQFSFPQTQRAHFNTSIYTNKMMYKMCFHNKLFIKVNVPGIREKTLTLTNCYQMRELFFYLIFRIELQAFVW